MMELRAADKYRGFDNGDAPFLKAWRDCAQRIGLAPSQTEAMLDGWARSQHQISTVDGVVDWFVRETAGMHLTENQLVEIFSWAGKVEVSGPESTFAATPSMSQDIARQQEIERIMREGWRGYIKSAELQREYYDVTERLHAPVEAPAAQASPQRDDRGRFAKVDAKAQARIATIETLIPDQRSDYWRGPQAEALQAEYRDLLALPPPAPEGTP